MKTPPLLIASLVLAIGSIASPATRAEPTATSASSEIFARVGDQVIAQRDYEVALANGVRQKFYHGRPPEDELARFRREVGEKLILQVLLVAEAERRGIEPDREAVARQVADYERRYAGNAQWQRSRERVLPRLTGELERRSRLERLEASVRQVAMPGAAEARQFYLDRPDLFTEPERFRLSLILVKVEPGAAPEVREAARVEAERLRTSLVEGADFAEVARKHSADPSSAKGGDLGYLHRGMLPEAIERQFVDDLPRGALSPVTRVLEGYAIVRVDERKVAQLRRFEEVEASAAELLQRERAEKAWAAFAAELRAAAVVTLDESRYGQPMSAGAHGAR